MLSKLLLTNFAPSDLTDDLWQQLRGYAKDITLASVESPEYRGALSECDGLILRLGMTADSGLFDSAPHLKYLGMYGTGYGRIDVEEAGVRGITVTNVRDYSTESVAELVVAAAIMHLRDLPQELLHASENSYAEPAVRGKTLQSRAIGVIGVGAIGARVVKIMATGIGAHVSYSSRTRKPEIESSDITWSTLPDLVSHADVLTIHVPAGPQSSPLLDGELVRKIKDGALLINTSPNEVVDLEAIELRLKDGTLAYVMDHTDEMSKVDADRFRSYQGCIAFPPLGYVTEEADLKKQQVLVDNLGSFLAGKPVNVVS